MTTSCSKFKRRDGTAGIRGHLYETKLISLIYFRAIHDDTIEKFQLASNIDNVGAFDDICFRAEVAGFNKPFSVFIQAKHKEKQNQTLAIDLSTYFISYLKIREHFDPKKEDWFFKSTFDEAECLFVIYTTAKDEFVNNSEIENSYGAIVNDLIGTGGTVKQPDKLEERVKKLCDISMKEQMTHLAERIAQCIHNEIKFENLLTDDTVQRYHVILAQKVVDVSEIQPDKHRVATFRDDFFGTHEEYLTIFKNTLFKEILKRRKIDTTKVKSLLSEFLADTTDATKLSKVIGTVIIYNNGLLEMNKLYTEYFTPPLKGVYISHATVEQAVELAAKEILISKDKILEMKVPSAFGNKDLTLSPNENKKKKRIKHLTSRITNLLEKCEMSKTVIINESLKDEFLCLAAAIGNIFVFDKDTKLMKITDNFESLETDAKLLYESLKKEIKLINKKNKKKRRQKEGEEGERKGEGEGVVEGEAEAVAEEEEAEAAEEEEEAEEGEGKINLCEYKFNFNVNKFPKVLLECSEYEKSLATDFLNKLLIYSTQADEKTVEDNLKAEIEESLTLSDSFYAKIDEIFLKYHNEIQTWWLQPQEADYLTKNGELFKNTTRYMIADALMSSVSVPYVRLMKQYNYTFTEDAVNSLNLENQDLSTIIVTEYSILTVAKVMQYLQNMNYVALDFEDIVNLSASMRNVLRRELSLPNRDKVLIFVCNDTIDYKRRNTLRNIAEAVQAKRTIIITKESSVLMLQGYFSTARTVYDEKNGLIDITEDCRTRLFESGRVELEDMKFELKPLVGA